MWVRPCEGTNLVGNAKALRKSEWVIWEAKRELECVLRYFDKTTVVAEWVRLETWEGMDPSITLSLQIEKRDAKCYEKQAKRAWLTSAPPPPEQCYKYASAPLYDSFHCKDRTDGQLFSLSLPDNSITTWEIAFKTSPHSELKRASDFLQNRADITIKLTSNSRTMKQSK